MTNAVSSVSVSSLSSLADKDELKTSAVKPDELQKSVFTNTVSQAEPVISEAASKNEENKIFTEKANNVKDNSFTGIIKRIAKGSLQGIKNTFDFAFGCPPMAMASGAILIALAFSSKAVFALSAACLIGAVIGGALSGITNEFGPHKNKDE